MNKKVYIFDDNTDILELCTLILADEGYEIRTSSTAEAIIDQVIDYMPDLIFMDNWLPDMGGIEATQALKRCPELKHIPVIYFSANNDIRVLSERAGADSFLAKPFDIMELVDLVKFHTSK